MTVYLVGAGPGDPGLLTRRGADVLGRAEVVVFDRLVPSVLLELAPPGALRLDMGKWPGERGRQDEIHAALIEHGSVGKTVVRLKGGDPFVFGRGSEEIEALRAAGVDYEVVPGVSSAFAVPASAGVPVTHRGLSTSVTVVTGHVGEASAPGGVAWEALARAGGTIVILMGMEHRAEIAELLMAGGRPAETPVLVVQWGSTPAERSSRTTLVELHAVDLGPPATIVVGAVAGLDLRDQNRPLAGVSVVVTRPRAQSEELVAGLTAAGASVIVLPVIAIADPEDDWPLEEAAARAAEYDWIVFTSANAVEGFVTRLRDGRALAGVRLAAVGPATAAALARWHLVADLVSSGTGAGAEAGAAGLVATMPPAPASPAGSPAGSSASSGRSSSASRAPTARALFPRAAGAADVLAAGLRAKGWAVDEVEAYRTVAATRSEGATEEIIEAAAVADAVIFSSPSTVSEYLVLCGGRVPAVVACIGPATAAAAEGAGLVVDAVATEQSDRGLVAALVDHYRG